MKKKTELKVGQIWGVLPLEETLDVRTVRWIQTVWGSDTYSFLEYSHTGGIEKRESLKAFRFWITRKKAVLIGHYDFKTGKVIAKGK